MTDLTKNQIAYLIRLSETGRSDGDARMRNKLRKAGYVRNSKPDSFGCCKDELTPLGRLKVKAFRKEG